MVSTPRRLYVSDLHLDDPRSAHSQAFAKLLQSHAERSDEIYLLGDITEAWIGDDDDSPIADFLRATVAAAAGEAQVYVMHGNRDFLYGERFEGDTGASVLGDPHLLDNHTLLSHGDAYCTDDVSYQQLRTMLRSEAFAEQLAGMSLDERREMAKGLRGASSRETANKASNITDVNLDALGAEVRRLGADRVIHGHTHRPARHACEGYERVVLGDWHRCGWYATQGPEGTRLLCARLNQWD